MDIEMFGSLSNAFGPSGFEDDVVKTIAGNMREFDLSVDAMNNLYARMPQADTSKPVFMLDAHTDECGFMVQAVLDNGLLSIIMLGGMMITNLPAHSVWIRTRRGKLVKGIIVAKPVHFMTEKEKKNPDLSIETTYVDVGACSRQEVLEDFGINIGDPMVPDVSFEYDAQKGLCFGKAFDNRAGCACIIETMKKLLPVKEELKVNPVGAFASQEEVGERGAMVTGQIVKPDLAIVFEGSPSDDFFFRAEISQGRMRQGAQIRLRDVSYISHARFAFLAGKLARDFCIPYQESVRRGGGTDAGVIHHIGKAVPVLVLGVPCRYVHSHYNFCAESDLNACVDLAVSVIKSIDSDLLFSLCKQDLIL